MKEYNDLVNYVIANGERKENRTGVDTLSVFNYNYKVDLRQGFPLLTTKKISWKNIVVELLWFLSGRTDISLLKKHNCKFWDSWADENGKVPSAYGNFWRAFPVHLETELNGGSGRLVEPGLNDQIEFIVNELRRNRDSRRLVVSAWAPENAQNSKLPPCHSLFVLNTQYDVLGKPYLNLHLTQRSADVALGVPYNIASYSLLLMIIGQLVGLPVRYFAHTLIDAHIYTSKPDGSMKEYDHIPGLQEQISRPLFALPKVSIDPVIKELSDVEALIDADLEKILDAFKLSLYYPREPIKFKVAV